MVVGADRIIVLSMNIFIRRIVPFMSVALLCCFSSSLFWCSDTICKDEQEVDCTCLMCTLKTDHNSDSPTSDSHHETSCSCICQMSFTAPIRVVQLSPYHSQYAIFTATLDLPTEPTEVILKPPILQRLYDFHQTTILEKTPCGEYFFYPLS